MTLHNTSFVIAVGFLLTTSAPNFRLAKAAQGQPRLPSGRRAETTAGRQVRDAAGDASGRRGSPEYARKISDEAERLFLTEAISCLRAKAFRATIVMTWNLAYDHLLNWIAA
jgi:hypothetical protein